jgi:hypothetical protein
MEYNIAMRGFVEDEIVVLRFLLKSFSLVSCSEGGIN